MAVWIVLLMMVGGVSGESFYFPTYSSNPFVQCNSGSMAVSLCGSGSPFGVKCGYPIDYTIGCGDAEYIMNPPPKTPVTLGESRWICSERDGTYLKCDSNEVMTGVCVIGLGVPGGPKCTSSVICGSNTRYAIECTGLGAGFELDNQQNAPALGGDFVILDCAGRQPSFSLDGLTFRPSPFGRDLNKVLCGACLSGNLHACGGRASHAVCCDIKECNVGEQSIELSGMCVDCDPGRFKDFKGAGSCEDCGVGKYQPSRGQSTCVVCGAGKYQDLRGQGSCEECPAGRFNNKDATDTQYHDSVNDCELCPHDASVVLLGRYTSETGRTSCDPCRAGTYAAGTGQSQCTPCGSSVAGHWDITQQGLTSAQECDCDEGFTGSDCNQAECPATMSMVSLGLLLVEGLFPDELRVTGAKAARELGRETMARKIEAILRTADIDGDDFLERPEVTVALQGADMYVPANDLANLPIWTYPERDPETTLGARDLMSMWKPYGEYDHDVRLTNVIKIIVDNFVDTGAFYPGDRDVWVSARSTTTATIKDFAASYPNSTWSFDECDRMRVNGCRVSWSFQDDRSSVIPTDGLVAHWPLNESHGSRDASGSGLDCVSSNNGIIVEATAMKFDASTETFIHCPLQVTSAIGGAAPRTVCFAAQLDDWGSYPAFWYGQPTECREFGVRTVGDTTGLWRAQLYSTCDLDVSIPELVADNEFHHYCLSYDEAKTLRFYVDGTLKGSKSATLDTNIDSGYGIFYIGMWNRNGVHYFFNGRLAQVVVYDRALDVTAVSAVARHALTFVNLVTPTMPTGGLVAHWPLTAYDGGRDASGSGLDCAVVTGSRGANGITIEAAAFKFKASAGEYLICPKEVTSNIGGNAPRTVCFAAQLDDWGSYPAFSYGQPTECREFGVRTVGDTSGLWRAQLYSRCDLDVSFPEQPDANGFHHYCLSYDEATTIRFYVDGTLKGSKSATLDTNNDPDNGIFFIGLWDRGGVRSFFNGRLAQAVVYDRALPAGEIASVARYALLEIAVAAATVAQPSPSMSPPSSARVLYQQCIYRNGRLVPTENELTDADTLSSVCDYDVRSRTTKCNFHDVEEIQPQNNRKRYYCLRQLFCDPSKLDALGRCSEVDVDNSLTTFSCTTGLAFDGKPADFIPTYEGFSGIKFQFLDTSLEEKGFQVFRTMPDADPGERGQLIADIPVGSRKCGQQFAPVQYADREIGSVPQTRVTYVVAVKLDDDDRQEDGDDFEEEMRVDYISPWAAQIRVQIQSEGPRTPSRGSRWSSGTSSTSTATSSKIQIGKSSS